MVEWVDDGVWVVRAGAIVANSYILDAGEGCAALVDAGMDPEAIEAALGGLGKRPVAIYCTHGHFDHVGGARHFVDRYDVRAYLPRADLRVARTNNALLMLMGRSERIELPEFEPVDDGFTAEVGGDPLSYRHTPGHTPGSSMLLWRDALFTGDTMYARGMGLAQRPNEDLDGIRRSIRAMWPVILERTIHPGHGPSEKGAVVAEENRSLRSFLAQDAA
jgi:hydroxyacylglutathione hydrolase